MSLGGVHWVGHGHGSWVGHIAFFFIFLKNIFTIYKPENGKKLSSEFLKCLEFFQRKIKVVNIYIYIYILGFDHERNTKTCLRIFSGSPQDIKPEAYKPHTFSSLSKSHLLCFICSLWTSITQSSSFKKIKKKKQVERWTQVISIVVSSNCKGGS